MSFEPSAKAGGVGMDTSECLDCTAGIRCQVVCLLSKTQLQSFGNVLSRTPRPFCLVRPCPKGHFCLFEQLFGLDGYKPVMGERDGARARAAKAPKRRDCRVEIEIRRGRCRPKDTTVGQSHTDRVAGKEKARRGVHQAEMVFGMAGRVNGPQSPAPADINLVPVAQDVHSFARRRVETSEERVEKWSVDHGSRSDETSRIDEVASSLLVHVHLRRRKSARHVADTTGMVEVDVGDHDARKVVCLHT